MIPERRLERAKEHIFSMGVNDGASHVARANMQYGLAKLHYTQERLGYKANTTFITSPDETITRNASRWNQGIAYGGKISWGNGKEKVVMLDIKPNACGMLVGGINEIPEPKELIKKIYALEHESDYIDDVPVHWDLASSNHFIELFEVEQVNKHRKLPKYAVILHAGCPELKGDYLPDKLGLYFNQSKILKDMMKTIETPFGKSHVVLGSDAKEYYDFYKFADRFAKKRRELAFKKIFGSNNIITNVTHQGMANMNEIILGCHTFKNEQDIMPISIKADIPSYLVTGKKNLTTDQIEDLGFKHRANELGITNKLKKANLCPHGGGYKLPTVLTVNKIHELKKKRYFELEMLNSIGKNVISEMENLSYAYRSREVLLKTLEVGLCKMAAKLNPIYDMKV